MRHFVFNYRAHTDSAASAMHLEAVFDDDGVGLRVCVFIYNLYCIHKPNQTESSQANPSISHRAAKLQPAAEVHLVAGVLFCRMCILRGSCDLRTPF